MMIRASGDLGRRRHHHPSRYIDFFEAEGKNPFSSFLHSDSAFLSVLLLADAVFGVVLHERTSVYHSNVDRVQRLSRSHFRKQ